MLNAHADAARASSSSDGRIVGACSSTAAAAPRGLRAAMCSAAADAVPAASEIRRATSREGPSLRESVRRCMNDSAAPSHRDDDATIDHEYRGEALRLSTPTLPRRRLRGKQTPRRPREHDLTEQRAGVAPATPPLAGRVRAGSDPPG